jgi:hypothetical protein
MLRDSELPSIRSISEAVRTASKEHICLVCSQTIYEGERYWRFVYRNNSLRDRKHALRCIATHLECPR